MTKIAGSGTFSQTWIPGSGSVPNGSATLSKNPVIFPGEDLTNLLEDPDRNLLSLCIEKVHILLEHQILGNSPWSLQFFKNTD